MVYEDACPDSLRIPRYVWYLKEESMVTLGPTVKAWGMGSQVVMATQACPQLDIMVAVPTSAQHYWHFGETVGCGPCLLSAPPEVQRVKRLRLFTPCLSLSEGEKIHPRVRIQTLPGLHWSVDRVTLKRFISIWVYRVSRDLVCLFLIFWLGLVACEILVAWPGVEPTIPGSGNASPNH